MPLEAAGAGCGPDAAEVGFTVVDVGFTVVDVVCGKLVGCCMLGHHGMVQLGGHAGAI